MKVLVAGASGFVGTKLCPALIEAGHEVRAMTRHPDDYDGAGTPVKADVQDPHAVAEAMAGCDAAYFLVHSLDDADFEERDAEAARIFGGEARKAGLQRIVYLGGLGEDNDSLSPHLRSRRDVEKILDDSGVPVTALRAGIIIGHGSVSWEMTRQLVAHLPAMITPRWVATRTQPIAIDDVVRYLVGVLELPEAAGRALEIGGPDVLEYKDMLQRVARLQGRSLPIVPVPLLTPRVSSMWLSLVTDVDPMTGQNLVDSMTNEVVVHDDAIRELVPFEPMSYEEAVKVALAEREAAGLHDEDGSPGTDGDQGTGGVAGKAFRKLLGVMPKPFSLQQPTVAEESDEVRMRRRRVVGAVAVGGAGLLAVSLSAQPGSQKFLWLTGALAATWTGGALLSGPLHLGWVQGLDDSLRRPIVTPIATGLAAFGVFYGGALVAREIPLLERAIGNVLAYADAGDSAAIALTTAVNGVAEELFFRGAAYTAAGAEHPVLVSSIAYTIVTAASRNPALTIAGGVMGALFGLQRRASGGIQAPVLTHLTWSMLMLRFLPPLFSRSIIREELA